MAKFNKDNFLNDITTKVQNAIDKNLITTRDIQNNDLDRLHGFIQYELLEYIEDRKFANDVLKDFNYDERVPWDKLQEKYGTFKSLLDIALVNLWMFIESEHAADYSYYKTDTYDANDKMLDTVHDIQQKDEQAVDRAMNGRNSNNTPSYNDDMDFMKDFEDYDEEPRRRKIRLKNTED